MTNSVKIIGITLGVIAISALPIWMNFSTKLVYNPSASAPIGYYWVDGIAANTKLKIGSYVVITTPSKYKLMAAKRHYLPINVPLIKKVVALSGDEICRQHQTVFINGKPVAEALIADTSGRKLPSWLGCFVLKGDEFFALMDAKDSFDGRYFGALKTKNIIGIAIILFETSP